MAPVTYISRVRIERIKGSLRKATLPQADPILFGVHDEVAEHYGTKAGEYEPHATTLDYVIAAAAG
jgi:hypothetical protein